MTSVQPLERLEIDGRSVAFEYGLLLYHHTGDEPADSWHVTLLGVPPQDLRWAVRRPRRECGLLAVTERGQRLCGHASLVASPSASDSLRLIGTSPLGPTEMQDRRDLHTGS